MKPDPELEAQERGNWFHSLVLCSFAWLPCVPLVLFYLVLFVLTILIIVHHLIVPVL